jgi:hypothetical protein
MCSVSLLLLQVLGGSNRALDRWLHAVGPTDPSLARQTDPQSLRAVFGGAERSSNLMHVQRAALMIGQDEQGDVLVGSHPSSFVNQHASEVVLGPYSLSQGFHHFDFFFTVALFLRSAFDIHHHEHPASWRITR